MKNRINKDLISNIEISEDMKTALYRNCIKGRSTADFAFRYSGLLSALIVVGVFVFTGIGASAAVLGVKARLENMSNEEYADYQYEVDNDTFVSVNEGESRALRDSEIRNIIRLEREYYDNNVYPENVLPHYETKSERSADELAYVEKDNLLYFPEDEMTDEQILQYIDHNAKKRYVNNQALIAEGIAPGVGMALESTPVVAGSRESEAVDEAKKIIKEFFKEDIDDSWIVLIDYFEEEQYEDEVIPALYDIDIFQLGIGYGTQYTIRLYANDFTPALINQNGYLETNDAKHYTKDEAEEYVEEGKASMKKLLSERFGFEENNLTTIEYYFDEYSGNATPFINYRFMYNDQVVSVLYRIEDGKMVSYSLR
ncbi:MAG: hypothetical protein II717_03180 [Lachnospiraceae bacterium]|nr:hypothetical protein [Lachnospiraceae bacterium]